MNYEYLYEIISDKDRVIIENIPSDYTDDVLHLVHGEPDAVVKAISTEEVQRVMKFAYENKIDVTPRGAGTSMVGSSIPTKGGIVLDMSLMNNVLELDYDTMTITVQAGILLQDLQAFVESKGLFYPPDPGEKTATLGGNVSTNAGGMRAVKYGVTRDFVRGLEVVLADGSLMTVGSKNVKDSSGLSLKNLIIGSEGTLCVVTKCLLRLIPKPETSKSVLIPFTDLETGIHSVGKFLQANLGPTAVEFMLRSVVKLGEDFLGIRYPHPEAGSYILMTFDGSKNEVNEHIRLLKPLAMECGAIDCIVLDDPAYSQEIWKVRGALCTAVEAYSMHEPMDIVVPIHRIAEYVSYCDGIQDECGMQIVSFGHAGDGNVHVLVVRGDRDEEAWVNDREKTLDKTYAKAFRLGGITSGEHGIGIVKRKHYFESTPRINIEIMNKIKDALDPDHILNENKAYVIKCN